MISLSETYHFSLKMLFYIALYAVVVALSAARGTDETCPIVHATTTCFKLSRGGEMLALGFNLKPLEENAENLDKQCELQEKNTVQKTRKEQNITVENLMGEEKARREKYRISKTFAGYLESAKCLNEQREQLAECEKIPRLRKSKEFEKELCSSLKSWLQCGYETIEEKCGSKALLVAKEIVSFNYNFLENICREYKLSSIKMLRSISAKLYE